LEVALLCVLFALYSNQETLLVVMFVVSIV
jgi:hypothetical protein